MFHSLQTQAPSATFYGSPKLKVPGPPQARLKITALFQRGRALCLEKQLLIQHKTRVETRSQCARVTGAGTWQDPCLWIWSGFHIFWVLGLVLLSHVYPYATLNFHCQHSLCNKDCRIFLQWHGSSQGDIRKICLCGVHFSRTKVHELEIRTLLTAYHLVQAWTPWENGSFLWLLVEILSINLRDNFKQLLLQIRPFLLFYLHCQLISVSWLARKIRIAHTANTFQRLKACD